MSQKRQINIEFLRIIAMLMVLALHANKAVPGWPEGDAILSANGIIHTLVESLCIVAVNVFVMISGWFGIKPSIKGFCNFMWQVAYCMAILLLLGKIFFNDPITFKSLCSLVGLYKGGGWFVASYIGLYIIAPVLNAYVDKTKPKDIALMLIAFFAFEFLWGNTLSVEFVVGGYSTFSFIGIYILAGFLRKLNVNYSLWRYWSIFLAASVVNAMIYIIAVKSNSIFLRDMVFNYINPLVIIASAALLLTFSQASTPPIMRLYIRVLYCGLLHQALPLTYYMSVQVCRRLCIETVPFYYLKIRKEC